MIPTTFALIPDLDPVKLDDLCQKRKLQFRQTIRDEINAKSVEIEMNANFQPDDAARPYGVEQEGQAFDVWSYILDNVTELSEVTKLCQVSDMFRGILKRKYVETKLPEILKLLFEKRPNYLTTDNEGFRSGGRSPMFLKLRLISKQCKKSTEEISNSWEPYHVRLAIWSVRTMRGITNILDANPSYAASSFPTRLTIHVGLEEEVDNMTRRILVPGYQQNLRLLLGKIGNRIHHFTYFTCVRRPEVVYGRLRELIRLLPNIQSLSIGVIELDPSPNLDEVPPFPSCPTLRSFEEILRPFSVPFVQRILEANPGIRNLHFAEEQIPRHWHRYVEVVREHSPEVLRTLVNLTSLHIRPYEQLLLERDLPWKRMLKRLVLDRNTNTSPTISFCALLMFLNQFQELEQLEMVADVNHDNDDYNGVLNLPKLKILKWRHRESFKTIDFMVNLGRLEELVIEISSDFMRNSTMMEKQERIIGSFLGKDIMDVFPYLKKVRVYQFD